MDTVRCVGCGAGFPNVPGPVHPYMESCPGCWAAYGEVLAREYADAEYRKVHRLTVDAYAVQHPGQPSRRSTQSVAVHLIGLCVVLEWNRSLADATQAIGRAAKAGDTFEWLTPPPSRGPGSVLDVRNAANAAGHASAVRGWAESAWQAWAPHHDQVRLWLKAVGA